MEGGQKIDLNLDSPLEVNSSDMLVPVNRAKFLHNRQRWQGHTLPTSLRYEHNGWAAGWYVYEFTYEAGYILPYNYSSGSSVALTRILYNNNPTYIVKVKEYDGGDIDDNRHPQFKWNPEASATSRDLTNLSYTSSYDSTSVTTINGTLDDTAVTVTVKSPAGLADENAFTTTVSPSHITADIDKSTLNVNGKTKITLTDTSKQVRVDSTLYLPTSLYVYCDADHIYELAKFVYYDSTAITQISYKSSLITIELTPQSNGTITISNNNADVYNENYDPASASNSANLITALSSTLNINSSVYVLGDYYYSTHDYYINSTVSLNFTSYICSVTDIGISSDNGNTLAQNIDDSFTLNCWYFTETDSVAQSDTSDSMAYSYDGTDTAVQKSFSRSIYLPFIASYSINVTELEDTYVAADTITLDSTKRTNIIYSEMKKLTDTNGNVTYGLVRIGLKQNQSCGSAYYDSTNNIYYEPITSVPYKDVSINATVQQKIGSADGYLFTYSSRFFIDGLYIYFNHDSQYVIDINNKQYKVDLSDLGVQGANVSGYSRMLPLTLGSIYRKWVIDSNAIFETYLDYDKNYAMLRPSLECVGSTVYKVVYKYAADAAVVPVGIVTDVSYSTIDGTAVTPNYFTAAFTILGIYTIDSSILYTGSSSSITIEADNAGQALLPPVSLNVTGPNSWPNNWTDEDNPTVTFRSTAYIVFRKVKVTNRLESETSWTVDECIVHLYLTDGSLHISNLHGSGTKRYISNISFSSSYGECRLKTNTTVDSISIEEDFYNTLLFNIQGGSSGSTLNIGSLYTGKFYCLYNAFNESVYTKCTIKLNDDTSTVAYFYVWAPYDTYRATSSYIRASGSNIETSDYDKTAQVEVQVKIDDTWYTASLPYSMNYWGSTETPDAYLFRGKSDVTNSLYDVQLIDNVVDTDLNNWGTSTSGAQFSSTSPCLIKNTASINSYNRTPSSMLYYTNYAGYGGYKGYGVVKGAKFRERDTNGDIYYVNGSSLSFVSQVRYNLSMSFNDSVNLLSYTKEYVQDGAIIATATRDTKNASNYYPVITTDTDFTPASLACTVYTTYIDSSKSLNISLYLLGITYQYTTSTANNVKFSLLTTDADSVVTHTSPTKVDTSNIGANSSLMLTMTGTTNNVYAIDSTAVNLTYLSYETNHAFFEYTVPTMLKQSATSDNHTVSTDALSWSIDSGTSKPVSKDIACNYVYYTQKAADMYTKSATNEHSIAFSYNILTKELSGYTSGPTSFTTGEAYSYTQWFKYSSSNADNTDNVKVFKVIWDYRYTMNCYGITYPWQSNSDIGNSNQWLPSYRDGVLVIASKVNDVTHYSYIDTTTWSTVLHYTATGNTILLPITDYTTFSNTAEVKYISMVQVQCTKVDIDFTRYLTGDITFIPCAVFGQDDTNSDNKVLADVTYNIVNVGTDNYKTHKFTFRYGGIGYVYYALTADVSFKDFDDVNSYMQIYSTDVRTNVKKHIYTIDCSKEKQILKQAWDTDVSTESFYWLDSTHYVQFTEDELIVFEKTTNITHWAGDKWSVSATYPKSTYITSAVKRYMFTNAYGSKAYARLLTFEAESNTMLKLSIHDLLDPNTDKVYYIQFVKRDLGEVLVYSVTDSTGATKETPIKLYSYTDILVPALLSEAKLTATCACDESAHGTVILGIHYDNNLCQWSLILSAYEHKHYNTITGYGYIGVDGSVTGNEIPYKYFNVKGGFTGTVNPLSVLDTEETETENTASIDILTEQIVGNESQQWYISRNLSKIVSHLTLASSGTSWNTPELLPLTNNYSMTYQSPSFVTRTSGSINIAAKSLRNIFPGSNSTYEKLWTAILVVCGYPLIYYLNPSISSINYLQQTLGQYAFVHYNSTINHQKNSTADSDDDNYGLSGMNEMGYSSEGNPLKPVLSDDLSFDVVTVPQKQTVGKFPWATLFYALGATTINTLEYAIEDTIVNRHQNQSAVSDRGNKYSQAFLKNLESMTSTEFTVQSLTPTLKSEVTALKTLDMFYSTSNGQHIEAGPGFVVHNFVAQCTAQSVTSVQLESQRMTMTFIIKALTLYQLQLEHYIVQASIDLLDDQARSQGNGGYSWFLAGVADGGGLNFGWFAALVLDSLKAAATILNAGIEISLRNIEPFLDGMGADHIRSEITAKQSKHVYDIEAKHRYGSKHETFMWPCFGCTAKEFNDEYVQADTLSKPWDIDINPKSDGLDIDNINIHNDKPSTATISASDDIIDDCDGEIDYRIAACYGVSNVKTLPDDMAVICGVDSFLPSTTFKNENIQENEPVFNTPIIHDFIISDEYELSQTCVDGEVLWITCRDTKLIDGAPSNIVYSDGFCGIASTYTAIEVKQGVENIYIRPWAVTPEVLALNQTGMNCAFDQQVYHAFDGVGYRYTDWYGAAGMNKEFYTTQYAFQPNDRLKRSNKLPPNRFMGNFLFDPTMYVDTHDSIYVCTTIPAQQMGLEAGTVGEDKDDLRYALPIFSEFVSTLPAVVKTAQPYKLAVFDGITSLTTELRNTQTAYKTPVSDDFILGTQLYRATHEYICKVDTQMGAVIVTPLVPTLGMTYLGASPYEAWFYNQATRQYYSYSGGTDITLVDMLERFRDITGGAWDFINQEVVFPCLATMKRVDKQIVDDEDETDNIIVPAIRKGTVRGEITPPERTIFNTESWFRTLSMPSGLVYQGPNRCIINRFMYSAYMLKDIIANKRKWTRVPRESYHPVREYKEYYESPDNYIDDSNGVKGWTHNPFLLVTAPLGLNEETDCMFEWEITFAWTTEMEDIIADNEYIVVNVMAETFAPGGKVYGRPTHIYLTKDLFARSDAFGYYSFRYNSNNGIGNRERLHIWSDGYIAVSSIQVEYKPITERRNTILTQQVDIQGMQEM